MEIEEIYPPYIYSIKYDGEDTNEFERLFEDWRDMDGVIGFFEKNKDYLKSKAWSAVCELASMYNLNSLFRIWSQYPQSVQRHYAPSFQDYLNDLLAENPELYASTLHPKFLQSWDSLLRENVYHRDHYNAIAARMFPLFLENPYLWKMILHIGDSRQWNSLEELFAHLERNADDSYSDSLIQLKNLLIP